MRCPASMSRLALGEIPWAAHREKGDQTCLAEPAHRPGGARGVPAPDQGVGGRVVADVLHEAAELLGPEVRHRIVGGGRLSDDVRGDRARPLEGVVPVMDEEAVLVAPRREGGAVADRVDVRQRGAQVVVGEDLALGAQFDAGAA